MKISPSFLVLFITLLGLSGCATTSLRVIDESTAKKGAEPELQTVSEASIGSTVFKQFDLTYNRTYTLDNSATEKVGLGGKIVLSRGAALIPAMLSGNSCFLTSYLAYQDLLIGPHARVCLFDVDDDQHFESLKYAPGMIYFEKALSTPVGYSLKEVVEETPDSFSYELVLTSVSSDLVEVLYREYIGNLARPAFSQSVKYNIESVPTTIKFKNAQIEILSTEGNSLRYKVLSGF